MKIRNDLPRLNYKNYLLATCLFSLIPQAANCATATTTFNVTSSIAATCAIVANPLAFGVYSGTAIAQTTTLSVTCTNTTTYNVGLNAGNGSGSTVTTRKMTSGANTLNYGLYQNAAFTTNWGNTVGTDTLAGTGSGSTQTLTVYGQLPAAQTLNIGSYTDTITATITY